MKESVQYKGPISSADDGNLEGILINGAKFCTIRNVSEYFGVTLQTVRNWIRKRSFNYVVAIPLTKRKKVFLVLAEDVLKFDP